MKPKNILLCVLLFACVPLAASAPKEEKTPAPKPRLTQKQVLAGFVAWDKKLKTLSANFKQETFFETTTITSSIGKIYKNGKNLRLDTFDDDKLVQSAFTDKETIRIEDGSGALITTLPWNEWYQNQPNKALFDFGNYSQIIKHHQVDIFKEEEDGYYISLSPKQVNFEDEIPDIIQSRYELSFLLDKNDFFPKVISLSEEGVETKTTLSDISKNIKFTESD